MPMGYLYTDGVGRYLDASGAGDREDLAAQWDVSSTKSNIGSAFIDIYAQANAAGKPVAVDFLGRLQARVVVLWNKIGTGTQQLKVCDSSDPSKILHTFADLASGENDSGLISLPAWFLNSRRSIKLMALSSVTTDDPVFESARVYVR